MKREYDFSKARRGPLVPTDPNKTRVTIWLDTNLVDYLQSIVDRAGGGSYEDLINELLRERIEWPRESILETKEFSRRHKLAARSSVTKALEILDRLGVGNPPRPDDRIPPSYLKKTTSQKTTDALPNKNGESRLLRKSTR